MAPARRPAAQLPDLWRQAVDIRREWLDVGLSTEPADRTAAEAAVTAIYDRHHRARPAFVWVDSPAAALPHLAGLPTHDTMLSWVSGRRPRGRPPIAVDIAAGLSHLRTTLADGGPDPRTKPKKELRLRPAEALAGGLPFPELLRQGVYEALFDSLARNLYQPLRAALGGPSAVPVGWYGNQDAAWVAHFDCRHRLGLAQHRVFDGWAELTRSAGWWWPAEDRCVLVERPVVLEVEPVPGTWHGEVRPRRLRYRDGWAGLAGSGAGQ